MQKVMCWQSLKLVSFTVPLWQDTFCQVLQEWTPPVFVDEYSITFLSVCCKLAGLALGLDLVCVFANAWPMETCPLESAVKIDFSIEFAGLIMYFLQLSSSLLHLASCDTTLLLLGCSLLTPSILPCLLLLSKLFL